MADNATLPASGTTVRTLDRSTAQTQVMALDFGGEGTGAEQLATKANPYPVGITANYFTASTNNSTTAQLAAGATFTGTIETVFNQPVASLLLIADQPVTITINQFIDAGGTKLASTNSFSVLAPATFARSFAINGNYMQVLVKNVGAATTTTLTLDTAYGTLPVATQLLNDPVAINEIAGTGLSSALPAGAGVQPYLPVRPVAPVRFKADFNNALASTVNPAYWNTVVIGSGQTISQSAGLLAIAAGTTANSDVIIRSLTSFTNALALKWQATLSQRIANNNFFVELVDVIGDALAITINSATSVTVTFPSTTLPDGTTLSAANVGQSMYLGNFTGTAGQITGRYAIASVTGTAVTFTVAGFPATGSGTCSVFGWNYHQISYNGTTATNAGFDSQRRGYASGATTATINTTAAPGHVGLVVSEDDSLAFLDQLAASSTGIQTTTRASRAQNIPAYDVPLYLQIRSSNGSTAPATTTTLSMNFVSVDSYTPQTVGISNTKPQSLQSAQPVQVLNTPNIGTVTTVTTLTTLTTLASMTSGNLGIPGTIADQASAAITTTTTSATVTPTFGCSYEINCPVTAVSGTTPTLDIVVQESDDGGTNWFDVWHFPRITAVGMYRTPKLPLTGNRVRVVETLTGTTPSFTRARNRLQSSDSAPAMRRIFDRSLTAAQALNATTASMVMAASCRNVQMVIAMGAITTTAPVFKLQGSDDLGATWYDLPSGSLTSVASSTVQVTVPNVTADLVRAIVTTAGVAATLTYVALKAF